MGMELRIGVRAPRDPDAQTCLRAYETELASRFDDGFDPALSISATDEEMTPPGACSWSRPWTENPQAAAR